MNEPVVFTDIYPLWQFAWYETPAGKRALFVALFLVFFVGLVLFWYLWRRRAPYRAINRLIREIEHDPVRAPDAFVAALKHVAILRGKPVVHDISEKALFAQLDCTEDRVLESLIAARYGAVYAPIEMRQQWVVTLRTALKKAPTRQ